MGLKEELRDKTHEQILADYEMQEVVETVVPEARFSFSEWNVFLAALFFSKKFRVWEFSFVLDAKRKKPFRERVDITITQDENKQRVLKIVSQHVLEFAANVRLGNTPLGQALSIRGLGFNEPVVDTERGRPAVTFSLKPGSKETMTRVREINESRQGYNRASSILNHQGSSEAMRRFGHSRRRGKGKAGKH